MGFALRSAVHYHYIFTTDASEAQLAAANEVTGGELGSSVRKLVSLPYFEYVASSREAQVALCAALGVVPMDVTGQQAKVPEAGMPSHKPGDYDPLNPEGLIAKAFVAQYGENKPVMRQFWMSMGAQQSLVQVQRREQKAAATKEAGELQVSTPRPERGGKSPAEFHGKVEQLGQFAIDWLYQAQLWVQAEGFVRPVAKVVTYLKGDALAWWRDAGEEQLGSAVSFLHFKVAFLAKFVKASDSLTARIDLEACKQEGLSVEAYASKFKSISTRIMVGCQVDRTTQAQWFLKGLNGKVVNKLQGAVDHSVLMDIDSLVTAAMNVDANLHLAGRQDYHDHGKQSKGKGRFEAAAGQNPSQGEGAAQANMLQQGKGKAPLAGKRKQPAAADKCYKCGGTGQWSRECPNGQSSSDNRVGSQLHSITSDPVVSAIATGANAVPIRPRVRSLLETVKRKTGNKLIASIDDGDMVDVHAEDCIADVMADVHAEQPSVNALSEHGLTMSFAGTVGCEAPQPGQELPQQARGGGEGSS